MADPSAPSVVGPPGNPQAEQPQAQCRMSVAEGKPYAVPRLYADACDVQPPEFSDYETLAVNWGSPDQYEIVRKVGRGKYCDAFQGVHVPSGTQIVIKVLKPVKKRKIRREIKILQQLAGGPNIVKLLDVVRDPATRTPSLVFEFIPNIEYKTLYPSFSDLEVRHYILQIFIALDFCHSRGIIHRDVKPHNVMINHDTKQLRLIDWGLAEYYKQGTRINVRVASRYYKGPELLVDFQLYDYSLDVWSLGCVLAGLMFQKEPFFRGMDNVDQLVRICKVLGTDDLDAFVTKYQLSLDPAIEEQISRYPKKAWSRFVPTETALCHPQSLDLLDRMLRFDHADRILPKEAIQHVYFDEVRAGWPGNKTVVSEGN